MPADRRRWINPYLKAASDVLLLLSLEGYSMLLTNASKTQIFIVRKLFQLTSVGYINLPALSTIPRFVDFLPTRNSDLAVLGAAVLMYPSSR